MKIGLLLIALGYGYKIFLDAAKQKVKNLRLLGQLVGAIMMTVAIAGIVCMVTCYMSAGFCSMGQKMGYKSMCPIFGKQMPYSDMKTVPVK
ncbi:MAG: hypothetical protein COV74_02320 [Candidatus Omnitrophica bacterium CG11_big_fil_rev_8_21_14_0_20_45_26]|uniref:Uncharacterized protein n=1 Tax=Candidatus Abzuiibacterium crystallinum TaxID=1974748 RepID=A0A2H0LRD5_9BACT|nr:MAG: hypothetical protein COV74_02320 [Candidatus Omnitrophica bacterium CG11_big_fil_rev_8_21_14_0_20_45_26]PIW64574.1 MAG: hypothetical protein COW12_05645 [Candidatus Omnitrophica bacterium CG12_big_fil_rev_8_21_14_0_65_45_16]